MMWEARARVQRFDMILEAEVTRTGLAPVETADGCEWFSELWLRPGEVFWGICEDDSLRVMSAAIPARYHGPGALSALRDEIGDTDCQLSQFDEFAPPLPEVGAAGLFHLQSVGPVAGQLNLGAVRVAFLPEQTDGTVNVPAVPGRGRVTWDHEDFKQALRDAAASRELEWLLAAGEFVARVRLSDWQALERSRIVRTGEHRWRLPMMLEQIYRGVAESDSCGLVLVVQPGKRAERRNPATAKWRRNEAQRIALSVQRFSTSQALVIGFRDSTDVSPLDCLEIDAEGRLVLRRTTVAGGVPSFTVRADTALVSELVGEAAADEAAAGEAAAGESPVDDTSAGETP
jgi:hypothetical protein